MMKTVKNPRCIAFLITGVSLLAQGCAGHHPAHFHLAGGTLPGVSEDGIPYDAAMHLTTHMPILPSERVSASVQLVGEKGLDGDITASTKLYLHLRYE